MLSSPVRLYTNIICRVWNNHVGPKRIIVNETSKQHKVRQLQKKKIQV